MENTKREMRRLGGQIPGYRNLCRLYGSVHLGLLAWVAGER